MNIDTKSLEEWKKNYSKYIEFQIQCLPYTYEYGGMKFSKYQFPSFKDFESKLGDNKYDYSKHTFAVEFNFKNKPEGFHNKVNCNKRPDLYQGILYYSSFKGVQWNYKYEKL